MTLLSSQTLVPPSGELLDNGSLGMETLQFDKKGCEKGFQIFWPALDDLREDVWSCYAMLMFWTIGAQVHQPHRNPTNACSDAVLSSYILRLCTSWGVRYHPRILKVISFCLGAPFLVGLPKGEDERQPTLGRVWCSSSGTWRRNAEYRSLTHHPWQIRPWCFATTQFSRKILVVSHAPNTFNIHIWALGCQGCTSVARAELRVTPHHGKDCRIWVALGWLHGYSSQSPRGKPWPSPNRTYIILYIYIYICPKFGTLP